MSLEVIELDDQIAREICKWDKHYGKNNPNYEEILEYLETDSLTGYFKRYLGYTQNEETKLMDKIYGVKRRKGFALRNHDKIVAFSIVNVQEGKRNKNDLFIQSVVVDPTEVGNAYGRKLLSQIITHETEWQDDDLDKIMALINKNNHKSIMMMVDFGDMEFAHIKNYVQVYADFKKIKNNILKRQTEEVSEA